MPYPYKPPVQNRFVTVALADVGTAQTAYVIPGFQGRIKKAWAVINGAITGTDSTIVLAIGSGASPVTVTGGTITAAVSGSAAGSVFSATPSALNIFGSTDPIRILNGGESTGAQAASVTLELEPI